MSTINRFFIVVLACVVILISQEAHAQERNLIGINVSSEFSNYEDIRIFYGLLYQRHQTQHWGIETGLFYRPKTQNIQFDINGNDFNQIIIENHVSIPLFIKFYSNIVNVSVGPSFEYFVGAYESASTRNANHSLDDYNLDPPYSLSALLKVGKTFRVGKNLLIEPEVRVGNTIGTELFRYGFGLSVKYGI
jgi:hypothetical protein